MYAKIAIGHALKTKINPLLGKAKKFIRITVLST